MVDLMKIDTAERKKQAVPAIESANNSQVAATAIQNTGHSPRYVPDRAREKGRNGQAREPCANAFGHQDVQFASDAATADEQKRVLPNRPRGAADCRRERSKVLACAYPECQKADERKTRR